MTIDAARQFVSRIMSGEPPSIPELIKLLDDLVQTYHACPLGDVYDSEFDAPREEAGAATYARIAARFPNLGMYAVADPSVVLMEQPLVADAIDDLTDIVRDLRNSIMTYEAIGADDAHWDFRFNFQSHWGEHLRRLTWYLHLLQRDI